jgi:putative glutamine amidotransferase
VPTSPPSEADRRRPVIGITTGEVVATYGVWKEKAAVLPVDYCRAVLDSGGVPVILPSSPGFAGSVVEHIDGLMLTGGADVDPALYGQERHPKSQRPDTARDAFEMELLEAAVSRDVPVLAICRGIQIVNVWRGGTLHQHLPEVVASDIHMEVPGTYGRHRVRIEPASRLRAIVGVADALVPTHHHQAPDRIGAGLAASAWADDGTVEGLEDPTLRYLIAVQWHPEMGEDRSLFESLVRAATINPRPVVESLGMSREFNIPGCP